MHISRRTALRIAGTGGLLLAATAAGGAGFVATRSPTRALDPWKTAGQGRSDPRLRALSYAILAPNPHNQQPWSVALEGTDSALLYVDLDRRLPHTDPFDRQILIGLGCFLELLRMAAADERIAVETDLFPEGLPGDRLDARPVARMRFRPDAAEPDSLFAQVFDRRSAKEPFDTAQRPSPQQFQALAEAAATPGFVTAGTSDVEAVVRLHDIAWNAWTVELTTERTWKESIDLLRVGKAEIEANPDGIDVGGTMPELLKLFGMFEPEDALDPDNAVYQQTMEMYRETFAATPAFIWQSGPDDSRETQLAAGRAWLRLNMKATEMGLSFHPISQALQEYPEMAGAYRDLHAALSVEAPSRLQMFGRLGYGPAVPPSPRWPVERKIRTA